jgi:hypothetical protein
MIDTKDDLTMTDATPVQDKPENNTPPVAVETAEAPKAPPAPPPFNVDILTSCTARYSRRAWDLFLTYRAEKSLDKMQHLPIRAMLKALSSKGLEELVTILKAAGVSPISIEGPKAEFTATFAQIQTVIKHPQTLEFDAIKI